MELLILSKRRRRTQTRQIKTINPDMTGGGRGDKTENSVTLERDDTGDKVKVDSKDINTVNRRENREFNQPQVSTTASSGSIEKIVDKKKYFPLFERKVKKTRGDEKTEQSAPAQHNTSADKNLETKPKEEEID